MSVLLQASKSMNLTWGEAACCAEGGGEGRSGLGNRSLLQVSRPGVIRAGMSGSGGHCHA